MRIPLSFPAAVVALTIGVMPLSPAEAGPKNKAAKAYADETVEHPKSGHYRRGPEVRGFIQRRGGYSFAREDVINTYSDNRSKYGSVNSYRDSRVDRQTPNGPFDHGFFFDSGVSFGGIPSSSPYPN